jgi:sn-glycerol 3-phosphate transport system permease protein
MVERRPLLTAVSYIFLIIGIIIVLFPIYVALTASSHTVKDLLQAPIPLSWGGHFIQNYKTVLSSGIKAAGGEPIAPMLLNSFIMAFCIAVGKIIVSLLAAYAIVFFRFPFRKLSFWLIFITLMLPVQVRILPSFEVAARLDILNSYAGLTLPLIASATATFLFRQFFLTVPSELLEAARIDGAGPWCFFKDILLPLSKTNMAAIFIIMFVYGWNQYLWPLIITTQDNMTTVVMGIQRLANMANQIPQWNLIMANAMLATLPPVVIVVLLQRWFVKGLIETEK